MSKYILCAALVSLSLPTCGEGNGKLLNGDGGGEARFCQIDENCDTGDPCRIGACNPATRTCAFTAFDGDGDGEPPQVCGGNDCNDAAPSVHTDAREIPGNGRDDNCNGQVDETGEGPDDDPSCRTNESCTVLFCGSWSWYYTELAYEEGMGDAGWLQGLRRILLQDGVRTIRQDGCALDIAPVSSREDSSPGSINVMVDPAPFGFIYEESVRWSDEETSVYCTGAISSDHERIIGMCDGSHGIMAGAVVPYTVRVTIIRQ